MRRLLPLCSCSPARSRRAEQPLRGRRGRDRGAGEAGLRDEAGRSTRWWSAPGATQALVEHKLKAPWPGRLVKLHAADGAHVAQGEVVAEILSQESEAAIAGAESMGRSARTPRRRRRRPARSRSPAAAR